MQFVFLPNFKLLRPEGPERGLPPLVADAYAAARTSLGLAALQPFPVDHILDSHGLVLEGQGGWKVVFSADTRPCDAVRADGA